MLLSIVTLHSTSEFIAFSPEANYPASGVQEKDEMNITLLTSRASF